MSGPGFTTIDLVTIAAFAANYAFVAPASAVCAAVGIARRGRGPQTWLLPIAGINVVVAGIQLVLADEMQWWLSALLGLQVLGALAILAWVVRTRRASRAG